jgi:4a-hydroxytetrahydrobiopterin dehydratase
MTYDQDAVLSRTEASDAVEAIGWRYLLGTLAASIPVLSLGEANEVARTVISASGDDGDEHLRLDLRPDRVELSLQTRAKVALTARDTELAQRLTSALEVAGFRPSGATTNDLQRPVEMLELAIDAMDIAAIRPFWKAVLGYDSEPGHDGPTDAIIDPAGQLPAIWFQQMDKPREERNNIHVDVTVAHDEAEARVQAAIEAGGHLVDDSFARSFWILADAEGNEVCVCTWTDRDDRA